MKTATSGASAVSSPLSNPPTPVRRGKPRGEKGSPGKDFSGEVENLVEENLMLNSKMLELNGTLSAQNANVCRLEQTKGKWFVF